MASINYTKLDEYSKADAKTKHILAKYFDIISTKRQTQKKMFRRVKDCYYGRYSDHYSAFFSSVVSEFDKQDNLVFDDALFTRDVVQNLALIYREKPIRSFFKGDVELEDTEYYENIYNGLGNLTDQTLNQMIKALATSEYQVYYDGKIKGRVITPDLYDILQNANNPQEKEALIYEVRSEDSANAGQQRIVEFIYWDKDFNGHFQIVYNVQLNENVTTYYPISLKKTDYNDNPYGVIPFIRVVDSESFNNYFQDDNASMFDNAEQILTVKASAKAQAYVYQGFSVPTLTTGTPSKYADFKLSPAVLRVLQKGVGNDSDDRLEFVSTGTTLDSVESAYEKAYLAKLKVFGISQSDGSVSTSKSGISIALSKDQQNKVINSDREKYVNFEKQRWELIKIVNNYHAKKAGNDLKIIPDDIEIDVNFKEIETNLSTSDRIDYEQHNLDNKIWGFEDLYKFRDPDISPEKLEEKVKAAEERVALDFDISDAIEEPIEEIDDPDGA